MDLTEKIEIPRRTMVLFFVIDTSGSMFGSKIGAVNSAIDEVIPDIKEVSNTNADALIKIAVLEFSTGAKWMPLTENGPVEVENFRWSHLDVGGITDLGAACKALKEKLSATTGFMKEATGSYAPVIILLSDGEPTDNYQHALSQLKQNNWFKVAIKVALAVGHDANKDVLAEFTGSPEAVIEVNNRDVLKRMIKFVSVRASQVASGPQDLTGLGDAAKQQAVNTAIQAEVATQPNNDQDDWQKL